MNKVIDKDEALALAAGDTDLARDMFNMLVNELPERARAMHTAYDAGDRDALQHHVHKINGATRYIGVPALREAAASLEQAIKQQADDIAGLHDAVQREIERVLAAADDYL